MKILQQKFCNKQTVSMAKLLKSLVYSGGRKSKPPTRYSTYLYALAQS